MPSTFSRKPRPPYSRYHLWLMANPERRGGNARLRTPRARRPVPIDVEDLRRRLGLTRTQFARHFGFSVETVKHWERGDRKPQGAAKVLLSVIAHNPAAVLDALIPEFAKSHEEIVTKP